MPAGRKTPKTTTAAEAKWTKAPFANLLRYEPTKTYFARVRVDGKLHRRSLHTQVLSVAKLRLADLERSLRQAAESNTSATQGKMVFGEALRQLTARIEGDPRLKPRSKRYYQQRIAALRKSWPELDQRDVRAISKSNCLNWAARFGKTASPAAFNNTVAVLRRAFDIAIELGIRYDNPATDIRRVGVRAKRLTLPEHSRFEEFVAAIESAGGRYSRNCAHLVRFLAYGGFRISEARHITWADCNFQRREITVRGEPENGTKNSEVRTVPMIPEMLTFLQSLRARRSEEPPTAVVMEVHEAAASMRRATRALGMAHLTHHDLRHLFATRCIESGVDIPTVSRWLGHKDGGALAMRVYGHLRDEHSASMAQKVSFSASPNPSSEAVADVPATPED